jgi:hypothetical protein
VPMLFVRCAGLCVALCTLGVAAQPAEDFPAWEVRTSTSVGQGFAIRNPDAGVNCVVVTASHVVKYGDSVTLTGLDRAAATPRRVQVPARVLHLFPDALLAVVLPSAPLPACPQLRIGDARAAEQSDRISRAPMVLPATGEPVYARLLIEAARSEALLLAAVGSRRVEPSWSGGLVTLDGQPLAVVQTVEDRGVTASRLDHSRSFVDKYASWPPPTPPRAAWDSSGLPPEYQKIYADALEIKRLAEVAQRVAQQNSRFAEEAELRARGSAPNHGEVALSDRHYRGQLLEGRPHGYGVLRHTSGDSIGTSIQGTFRTTKVNPDGTYSYAAIGPGVWKLEFGPGNKNSHSLYEGEIGVEGGGYNGLAVLTFLSGDTVWSRWDRGDNNAPMMFFRKSDGAWFSGTAVKGRWEGPGILWSRDGQIVSWGVWRDGALTRDLADARR